jgi:hypothetical protein
VSVDASNTIPNIVANSIIADGGGIDWTSISVLVELTAGHIYNGVPDGNTPQSAFWNVPGFEQLEWDTWFGIPGDPTNGISNTEGGFPDRPFSIAGQKISVTLFNNTATDTGPTRVSNISLSADAQGTWRMINAFTGGVSVHTDGVVINGVMVPEPSALVLLTVGGFAMMKRK